VRPAWGSLNIRDVRTVAVECWLHQLVRKEGNPLAPSTKVKIRNLMSGWHTFRRSFSTMLIANDENVKVVQELMRHSNCRCTLEIYSQARLQAKRDAQHRLLR
jgi:integrase